MRRALKMENKGLVHLDTGDGKGKTTAAVGLLVRAAGAGKRGLFCQFLKGQDTAELESLKRLGVDVLRTDEVKQFFPFMKEEEKKACVKSHNMCYNKGKDLLLSGKYDMVVLDEVTHAAALRLIPLDDLVETIRNRPSGVEVVLTGRDAPEELCKIADYLSDIRCLRHPYEKGIPARRGIEY